MKKSKYHIYIGAKESCTKKMMEATKELDQINVKGSTNYCFLFYSWFSSKSPSEAVMGVVAYMVGLVKTNKK